MLYKNYKDKLPEALVSYSGNSSFGNGLITLVNPKDYEDIIKEGYSDYKNTIPFAITGLGGILVWENNKYINLLQFSINRLTVISSGFDTFFEDLNDNKFLNKYFGKALFDKLSKSIGKLSNGECYTMSPLPVLGGDANNIKYSIGKVKEYCKLCIDMAGPITGSKKKSLKEAFTKIFTKDGKRVRYTDDEKILREWYDIIVMGVKKLSFASVDIDYDNLARISIKISKSKFKSIDKAFEFINTLLDKSRAIILKKYRSKAIENNEISLSFRDKVVSDDDPEYYGFLYAIDCFVPYIDEAASFIYEGFFSGMKANAEMKSLYKRFQQYKLKREIDKHEKELYDNLNKISFKDLNSLCKKWYNEIKSALKSYIDKLAKEEKDKKERQANAEKKRQEWLNKFKDAPEWNSNTTSKVISYINSKVVPVLLSPEYRKDIRGAIDEELKDKNTLLEIDEPDGWDRQYIDDKNAIPEIKATEFSNDIIEVLPDATQGMRIILCGYVTDPIAEIFGAGTGDGDEGCIYL